MDSWYIPSQLVSFIQLFKDWRTQVYQGSTYLYHLANGTLLKGLPSFDKSDRQRTLYDSPVFEAVDNSLHMDPDIGVYPRCFNFLSLYDMQFWEIYYFFAHMCLDINKYNLNDGQ